MMIYKVARLLCLSNVTTPLLTKILVIKGKLPLKIGHVIYNSGMTLHHDLHYLQKYLLHKSSNGLHWSHTTPKRKGYFCMRPSHIQLKCFEENEYILILYIL